MNQSDKEYKINEKRNKERFLQYFPTDENRKYLTRVKEEKKTDRKTCIYCGSIHVIQYDQELYGVCEDCRAEFLDGKHEFESILRQTQNNLKQLMEIPINLNMCVIYRRNWLQQSGEHFRKSKEKRDNFGKDFVRVRTKENTVTFIVHGILSRSLFMYLISGYMIGFFLEKMLPKLSENMVYHPIKYAMMKWGSMHYMYLNGYINFCRWKNMDELKDIEYKELTEKIGGPLENNRKDISEIITILNKKIAEPEREERQEKSEKVQHLSD